MKTYTNLTAFLLAGLAAGFVADKFDSRKIVGLLNDYADNMETRHSDEADILAAATAAWEQTDAPATFASSITDSTTTAEDAESVLQNFTPEHRTGPEDDRVSGGPEDVDPDHGSEEDEDFPAEDDC